MENHSRIFPHDFLWGASISSHQVEGDNTNDWTEWETSAKRTLDLHASGQVEKYGLENFLSKKAANHYHLYKQDYAMAKELGHNALRLSLEWSRIEPKQGEFNLEEIERYRTMILELRAQGIEPLVTLWHWTVPLWFRDAGGWASSMAPQYFARYVEKVVSILKDEVTFWITLNEPEIYSSQSYLTGVWPPQKKSLVSYLRVYHELIRGHKQAYEIIHRILPGAQVGIAKNNIYFEAHNHHFWNRLLKRASDWWWNEYFLNRIQKHQDFIGVNYYFHNKINGWFGKNDNKTMSDLHWELHPEGIYHVLTDLKKYGKPIYITENGLADATDDKRVWFIQEILKFVHQALEHGVPVKGYLHWSLIDNFEWDKGFYPRFGLVEVDYATHERKPRQSAHTYKEIINRRGIVAKDD